MIRTRHPNCPACDDLIADAHAAGETVRAATGNLLHEAIIDVDAELEPRALQLVARLRFVHEQTVVHLHDRPETYYSQAADTIESLLAARSHK